MHLDLKSANLLVDHNWNLKVADFGMATTKRHFYVNTEGGGAGGGAHGGVGTPQWTAPEVLRGDPFNERADVYSFGVVMWEVCTRRRPFEWLMAVQASGCIRPWHKLLIRSFVPHPPQCLFVTQVVPAVAFGRLRPSEVEDARADPLMLELMQQCLDPAWPQRPLFANTSTSTRTAPAHEGDAKIERQDLAATLIPILPRMEAIVQRYSDRD